MAAEPSHLTSRSRARTHARTHARTDARPRNPAAFRPRTLQLQSQVHPIKARFPKYVVVSTVSSLLWGWHLALKHMLGSVAPVSHAALERAGAQRAACK